jgi:hypothetical protein
VLRVHETRFLRLSTGDALAANLIGRPPFDIAPFFEHIAKLIGFVDGMTATFEPVNSVGWGNRA